MKSEKEIRKEIARMIDFLIRDTTQHPMKVHTFQREKVKILRWVLGEEE